MTDKEHDDDRELMARIVKKDLSAYRTLVNKHLARYTRFAERMLGSHNDAKDIMQDVCLKLWNQPEAWQPDARFTTWLYRVVANACIDHQRKRWRLTGSEVPDRADESPDQEEVIIRRQRINSVKDAMIMLPDRQRQALVLSYYEEESNQDAAEAMGLQLGAFQQLLFRARQNLKTMLMEDDEGKRSHG